MTRGPGPDLDGWIRDRIRHGEHVVAYRPHGSALLHPGCGPGECEFSGQRLAVHATLDQPVYVAELSDDGIRPKTGDTD